MERRVVFGRLLAVVMGLFAALLPVRSQARGRQPQEAGPQAGYGQCRKCDCTRFRGSGNWCKCDHSFYDHQ